MQHVAGKLAIRWDKPTVMWWAAYKPNSFSFSKPPSGVCRDHNSK